ncbi:YceH family protein [Thioalkalivibrio sp. ALJT]|uniref:YceH family protein n=1 Tax=Thioalkalivibrio sp. ALJT TaxID=1158146 RepID=UPI00037387B6|nr:DUF480 domain-containing protein [Thioalkalivibrio sp. ALJT]
MSDPSENAPGLPLEPPLEPEEARVLGCLIEKAAATPESYPLTLNATVTAANQKTSRHPVMKLEPGQVGQALRKLEQRGLVKSDVGARATRYAHKANHVLELTPGQSAIIGLLLLRGPQTVAELYTRAERLHGFDDQEGVRDNLQSLAGREAPLITDLGRAPGQREDRYMHRLCGEIDGERLQRSVASASRAATPDSPAVTDRLKALEARVAELEAHLGLKSSGADGAED